MSTNNENNGDNGNEAESGTAIELNLRLDNDGRTAALVAASTDADAVTNDSENGPAKKAKIDSESAEPDADIHASAAVDYSSKTTLTSLASLDNSSMGKCMEKVKSKTTRAL
eukprot:CAMPEP_0183730222 /NCGR_PEP_ID=MMETSP0737-20130205/32291_1 /TAXON_ID=385413 /ORGANISM="Thalassiosira miniscula, Strain CCMP1093" /LENGTH=111 /DNA_ID=CAMNT_0025962657 /DNA_START=259 /DNA_END=591 /DNA_ORIENTATION=+